MKTTEIINALRYFNAWRRGYEDELEMPDPTEIGLVIDEACKRLGQLESLQVEGRYSVAVAKQLRDQRDMLASRIEHAEIILGKISSGYWQVVLNDAADGWHPGDEVSGYWQTWKPMEGGAQ